MEEIVKVLRAKSAAAKAEADRLEGVSTEHYVLANQAGDAAYRLKERARMFAAAANALEDTPASE